MKHETLYPNHLFDNNNSGNEVKQTLKHQDIRWLYSAILGKHN